MDSRKIISREPLFEIILLNVELPWKESNAFFFFFLEMLNFKNKNVYTGKGERKFRCR